MENPSFTLDELVKHLHNQAVSLMAANRYVDQRLLYPHTVRKLARSYLQYAVRQDFVHSKDSHTWAPKISNLTIKVASGDVGYRQARLAYAWNELQEMLSVNSPNANSIPVMQ